MRFRPSLKVKRDAKERPKRIVPRNAKLRRKVRKGSGDHAADRKARNGRTRIGQTRTRIALALGDRIRRIDATK
jgi:hypothetical protein